MGFEEFLPEEEEIEERSGEVEKISPNQVYGIITSKKPDWQSIIYELVNSEQLDPWDIDIVILTQRYFERILGMEQIPDFYVSSKVLLAASLLLRLKSEFLYDRHLRSVDDILFGRKEEAPKGIERIEIDDEELPILMPRTPLSRQRKITLPELMSALNKAINTESRRIRKVVNIKRAEKLSHVDIPNFRRIDLKDRIRQFYARILTSLKKEKKPENKVSYNNLVGKEREEKLACFLPLLHLSNNRKLWLEQENHLEEIWIYLYEYFEKNKEDFIKELEEDIEDMKEELGESVSGGSGSGLEKARRKKDEKKKLEEDVKKELMSELNEIVKEEKIEEISGFSQE